MSAQLQGAVLYLVKLQGADLVGAELQGVDLERAKLQGADLERAKLQGADLRGTRLWQTSVNAETNLSLADLRYALWRPIGADKTTQLQGIIDAFPLDEFWQREGKARLERLIAPGADSDDPPEFALDGLLLVDDLDDPRWQRLDRTRLTSDERAYDQALGPFLGDLARSDPNVARGLAYRIEDYEQGRGARLARGILDRAGPALPEDVRQRLSKIASQPGLAACG